MQEMNLRSMKLVSEGQPLQFFSSSEVPKVERGAALIKVGLSGVCHTDLHLIEGSYDLGNGRKLPAGIKLPVTLGHEIAGIVEEISSDYEEKEIPSSILSPASASEKKTIARKGDQVVVYPWIGCGSCRKCRSGLENLCEEKSRFLGVFQDGGYSNYVLVPNARYLVNATRVDPKQSAPLACSGLTAFTSIKKCSSNLKTEDDLLLIIGAGGLGTTAIQIAKKITRAKIVVLDLDEGKLELAARLGADHVFNSSKLAEKDIVSQLRAITSRRGADAVIDFVGIPATSSIGFRVLARGGRLVLVGLGGGMAELPLPFFPLRGAQIIGNFTGTLEDLIELVDIVRKGIISPVVSRVYPLEEANLALDKLKRGEVEGRVMLQP